MKRFILLVFSLAIAFTLSSCSGQSSVPTSEAETPTVEPSTTSPVADPVVENQASLLLDLQHAGATTEVADTVIQDFFTPEGNIIRVNGEDIQVFEYEDAEAMEREAAQVAPDGGSVGTSMMMWVDAPHFYKAGRIIVLYVGSYAPVLDLLDNVMGPQFAGR